MVKIFGNYITLTIVGLALCEVALFVAALVAVIALLPHLGAGAEVSSAVNPFSIAALAGINAGSAFVGGLYNRDAFYSSADTRRRAATALVLIIVGLAAFLVPYTSLIGARFSTFFAACVAALVIQAGGVGVIRVLFVNIFDVAGLKRRVVVLGTGELAYHIDEWFRANRPHDLQIIGFIPFGNDRRNDLGARARVLHSSSEHGLSDLILTTGLDEIVVAHDSGRGGPAEELLECRTSGVRVVDFLTFWERETGEINVDWVRPSWLTYADGFKVSLSRRLVQRGFDIAFSSLALVFLAPLILATAALIKLDSPGPAFFRQERVGLNGQVFRLTKFRSMRENAEAESGATWATANDPRATRVGRLIRRSRIDEIPQFFDVLRGAMSLVGPRPERPEFVAELRNKIQYYDLRHKVKPGITGWAQINYPYGSSIADAKRKLGYDLYYAKNGGFFLDIVILLHTVRIVLWLQGGR